MPLITADDLCQATETTLRTHYEPLAASRGLTPLATWDQLPDLDALTRANLPAGAITTPGLTAKPVRRSTGFDATWRIVVGVYDRGRDYAETAHRVRTWAAVIRQTLMHHPTLGGLATGLEWVGEEYAELSAREAARTLGGCAVAFDVTTRDVIDATPYDQETAGEPRPIVTSTHRRVSIRRPSTET